MRFCFAVETVTLCWLYSRSVYEVTRRCCAFVNVWFIFRHFLVHQCHWCWVWKMERREKKSYKYDMFCYTSARTLEEGSRTFLFCLFLKMGPSKVCFVNSLRPRPSLIRATRRLASPWHSRATNSHISKLFPSKNEQKFSLLPLSVLGDSNKSFICLWQTTNVDSFWTYFVLLCVVIMNKWISCETDEIITGHCA